MRVWKQQVDVGGTPVDAHDKPWLRCLSCRDEMSIPAWEDGDWAIGRPLMTWPEGDLDLVEAHVSGPHRVSIDDGMSENTLASIYNPMQRFGVNRPWQGKEECGNAGE